MNAFRFTVLSFALAVLLVPSATRADFTTVLGASKDNTMFENVPNNSGGGAAGIFSGANSALSRRRGLIEFNIAGSVPAGSTITGIELSMYLANAPNTNNQTIELHRMSFDWGEITTDTTSPLVATMGNGVPAAAGDATWNGNFFGTSTWASLGTTTAPGANNAFSSTVSGSSLVGGAVDTQKKWLSTGMLISDAQGWLDNPATNFGWAIINAAEGTSQSMKAFYSRQATLNNGGQGTTIDPTWRPSLEVTYVNSAPPSGDYNGDGIVDAADYVVWRKTFNLSGLPAGSGADGNQNSMIDAGDYMYWSTRFGNPGSGLGSGAAVREPAVMLMLLVAAPLVFFPGRR